MVGLATWNDQRWNLRRYHVITHATTVTNILLFSQARWPCSMACMVLHVHELLGAVRNNVNHGVPILISFSFYLQKVDI